MVSEPNGSTLEGGGRTIKNIFFYLSTDKEKVAIPKRIANRAKAISIIILIFLLKNLFL